MKWLYREMWLALFVQYEVLFFKNGDALVKSSRQA